MGFTWRTMAASTIVSVLTTWSAAHAQTPILAFDFDEGSGTVAANSGTLGPGSDATVSGATFSADSAAASGFSLSFDGDIDFVEVDDTFDYGDKVTLEMWIKPERVTGQQALYDDYGNPGVFMALFDEELEWGISTTTHPGLGVAIFDGVVCEGLWQHVAGTYDGAMLRAYVSGVEVGTAASSGSIIDNANNATHIGADSATPNELEFQGRIDDVHLFLTALTPQKLGDGAPLHVCGELTGDCTIGTNDALAALQMAVELRDADGAADVDDSSTITAGDALAILRVAVDIDEQTNDCNGL